MKFHDHDLRMKFIDFTHVDVLLGTKVLPDGRGMLKEDAVKLLKQFAATNGPTIIQTEQLDGSVERDIIHPNGTVEPFYNVQSTTEQIDLPLNTSLVESLREAIATGEVKQPEKAQESFNGPSLLQSMDYINVEEQIRLAQLAAGAPKNSLTRSQLPASPPVGKYRKTVIICIAAAIAFAVVGLLVLTS